MFDELYTTVKNRYGAANASMGMADWIALNTTLNSKRFGYEGYEFQRAIADDMHPDLTVKKCSQVGLALALDTPVPTNTGWTTMGDVKVGDRLFDENGKLCTVTYVSPIYQDRACFEIEFDDGEVIVADGNHRWYVEADRAFDISGNYAGKGRPAEGAEMFKSGVLTTNQIHLFHKHGDRNRFAIPNTQPLDLPEKDLPIDPYYLGVWLGDGNTYASVVTAHEDDAKQLVPVLQERGFECAESSRKASTLQLNVRFPDQRRPGRGTPNSPSWVLKQMGLLGQTKHIPNEYLRASAYQRTELLSGLLDTDGTITKNGRVSFYNTNTALVVGVAELARSLGYKTRTRWRQPTEQGFGGKLTLAEVSFVAYDDSDLFNLPRKADRLKVRSEGRPSEALRRRIVSVRSTDTVPVRCLTVDSPNHLFLAGAGMIPTHNTEVQIRKFLGILARKNGTKGIFSLPSEKMYARIYNGRLKPIIDADEVFNPDTGVKPIRNRDMIQLRNSFGYITACSEGDATSISADFLFHDEVDLSPQEILALYQSRLQNSDMKVTQKFSTPTFNGFGIDRSYAMTDQREYMAQCEACNHWQIPLFQPKSVFIENFKFDVQSFTELSPEQIGLLDLDSSYVRCENCGRRLNLADPSRREWVATYPGRTLFRGYQVRPFSTSRLPPSYIFRQLAKYLEDSFPRGFYNTVLGEPHSDGQAEIQRSDVEACMKGAAIPNISDGTACFMGIDVGFTCHITISYDDAAGIPHFVLFEDVHISQLEERVAQLRKIYNIVQGVIDRFPYTTIADTLRETTSSLIMPAQYRGNAALSSQKNELGIITHYSVNNNNLFERMHSAISNHKMVISGYTNHRETLLAHLSDMKRNYDKDIGEILWQKNTGNDHFFHSMAFNLLGRRICEHLFQSGGNGQHFSSAVGIVDWADTGSSLMPDKGAKRLSRLGV